MHSSEHRRDLHMHPMTCIKQMLLAAAFSGSQALVAAQDTGDAGSPDGATRAGAYFNDETELRLPAPGCANTGDPEAEGCYTSSLVLSDLDGDGDLDIVYANGGGYYEPALAEPSSVLFNDGRGTFRDVTSAAFGGPVSRLRQVAIGDVDGDGDRDLFQPGGYGLDLDKLWVQTAPGVFEDKASSNLPVEERRQTGDAMGRPSDAGQGLRSKAASAHFGDLDGDGDLDLVIGDWGDIEGDPMTVTTVRLYRNDGTGAFAELPLDATPPPLPGSPPSVRYSSGPVDLDIHDLDGDFDLDLLIVGRNGQSRIFFNQGDFEFSDGTAGYPRKRGPYQYSQELCDVDGDGDLDLLVDNAGGMTDSGSLTQININDGKGSFTDETRQLIRDEPGGDDNAVKCMDVNADGHFDLVVASLTHAGEKLLVNSGTGSFTFVPNAFPAIEDPTLGIDAADLDGDAILDIVTAQGEGAPRVERLYRGAGMSRKDVSPPKFRAVERPSARAGTPIIMRMAVSDAASSDTGEHVVLVAVDCDIAGEKSTLPATFVGGDLFRVAIPAQSEGTAIRFTPSARDRAGLIGTAETFEVVVGAAGGADLGDADAGAEAPSTARDASAVADTGVARVPGAAERRRGSGACSLSAAASRDGSELLLIVGVPWALRRARRWRSPAGCGAKSARCVIALIGIAAIVAGCNSDPDSDVSGEKETSTTDATTSHRRRAERGGHEARAIRRLSRERTSFPISTPRAWR